jgi:hypothetical protein
MWSPVEALPEIKQLTVQLVSVQMLCAGVALPTALVRALKLLVEALSASPPLSRGAMAITFTIARVAIVVPVASTAAVLTTVRRGGGRGLTRSTNGAVHLVSKVCLDLSQIRRVRSMHVEDLCRHSQRGEELVARSCVAKAGRVACRVDKQWLLMLVKRRMANGEHAALGNHAAGDARENKWVSSCEGEQEGRRVDPGTSQRLRCGGWIGRGGSGSK